MARHDPDRASRRTNRYRSAYDLNDEMGSRDAQRPGWDRLPGRWGGNCRCFPRHVLRRLAFIAAAQRIGLSLTEIRKTLGALPAERPPTPQDWRRLSTPWLDRVDRAISELQVLKQSLDSCIGCGCLSLGQCSLLNPEDEAAAEGHGSRWLRPAAPPPTA